MAKNLKQSQQSVAAPSAIRPRRKPLKMSDLPVQRSAVDRSQATPPSNAAHYIPEFKGAIEGYVVNTLAREHWRIQRTHDWDDAMQEAHVVFLKLVAKYPLMDTPQHFMALFKTSWSRHLTDLGHKATVARALVSENSAEDEDGQTHSRESIGETENAGLLALMVSQAPAEVTSVLALFMNAPTEILELAMSAWRSRGHYRPEGEAFVCRALGLPPGSQPLRQLIEYFSGH